MPLLPPTPPLCSRRRRRRSCSLMHVSIVLNTRLVSAASSLPSIPSTILEFPPALLSRPPLFISYLYELSRSLTCYTCVCPSVCITCMIRDDFVLITTVTTLPHHQPCLPVIFLRRYHYSFIFFFIFLGFSGVIGPGI